MGLQHFITQEHHIIKQDRAGVWCTQKSTGSLGMVMTKTLAKQMLLQNTKAVFDWGIVAWLDKKNSYIGTD